LVFAKETYLLQKNTIFCKRDLSFAKETYLHTKLRHPQHPLVFSKVGCFAEETYLLQKRVSPSQLNAFFFVFLRPSEEGDTLFGKR